MLDYCFIELYFLQKCAQQAQGTDLCGYFVCEFIQNILSKRMNTRRNKEVRKQYSLVKTCENRGKQSEKFPSQFKLLSKIKIPKSI